MTYPFAPAGTSRSTVSIRTPASNASMRSCQARGGVKQTLSRGSRISLKRTSTGREGGRGITRFFFSHTNRSNFERKGSGSELFPKVVPSERLFPTQEASVRVGFPLISTGGTPRVNRGTRPIFRFYHMIVKPKRQGACGQRFAVTVLPDVSTAPPCPSARSAPSISRWPASIASLLLRAVGSSYPLPTNAWAVGTKPIHSFARLCYVSSPCYASRAGRMGLLRNTARHAILPRRPRLNTGYARGVARGSRFCDDGAAPAVPRFLSR